MITLRNISRYRAASTHLALSALVAALVLLIMLFLWYPPPLFMAMGGATLAKLIIGVDVTLGPLITLLIFDTRKKELAFDLAVVVALQLGALGYGVHTMFIARPAFIVFTGQELTVVCAADIPDEELAKASSDAFRHISMTGPLLVALQPPEKLMSAGVTSFMELGLQRKPMYFVPYADKRQQVLKQSMPLTDLKLEPQDKERLEKYLKQQTRSEDQLLYLPVTIERKRLIAVISAENGDVVNILDIKPSIEKQ